MKPFDLEAAKAGEKVVTRDGSLVRIVCFDVESSTHPILALVKGSCPSEHEIIIDFTERGTSRADGDSDWDLFMAPVKREGWINIYKHEGTYDCISRISETKDDAECSRGQDCVATVKVEWEE